MERIVLEVNDDTAKKWRTASLKFRKELNELIDKQLASILENNQVNDSIQFFEELRKEMADKGLTQEILDDILNGEA